MAGKKITFRGGTAEYRIYVYDDSVEMEGADWVQTIYPVEGTSVDCLVNGIISEMDLNGFTAADESKAA